MARMTATTHSSTHPMAAKVAMGAKGVRRRDGTTRPARDGHSQAGNLTPVLAWQR